MRLAIIGCGAVGQRRATVAQSIPGVEVAVVVDVDRAKADKLGHDLGCRSSADWRTVVPRRDVDLVVVATSNDVHAQISVASLECGKHVLCEKPLARTPGDAEQIVHTAHRTGRRIKTGFNHRYFPSVLRARRLVDDGAIGRPLWARCRYGHGGKAGFERAWFTNHALSGGGTFLDNGVHALDLFRWFLGDFTEAVGMTTTLWWDVGPCEDNGFGLFRTADGRVAQLHTSWTHWQPIFSFELFGSDGFLHCEGAERLVWAQRMPDFTRPSLNTENFPGQNNSWRDELADYVAAIQEDREPLGNGHDGWQAVRMAHAVYEAARTGQTVRLA